MDIDLNAIAQNMKSQQGTKVSDSEFHNWTYGIVDALQSLYDFETELYKIFKEGDTK